MEDLSKKTYHDYKLFMDKRWNVNKKWNDRIIKMGLVKEKKIVLNGECYTSLNEKEFTHWASNQNPIWTYIKADRFFKDYLPEIKNVRNKIRGKSTRNEDLDFTDWEKERIKAELGKLFKRLAK